MKSRKVKKKNRNRMPIEKSVLRIVALLIIISLNWTGILAIGETVAYYSDQEEGSANLFQATTLDFSLSQTADFAPEVKIDQPSQRTISVVKDGILGFNYTIQTANATGILCDYLDLEANLDGGTPEYIGSLPGFTFNAGEFSAPDDWQFTASVTNISDATILENQTCTFDLIFDGTQIEGAGFSDQEIISNTITFGSIPPPPPDTESCMKINEVYYDVDNSHGDDPRHEWIELYNACDHTINLKDWYFRDNFGQEIVHDNSHNVIPGQYVVVAANASVWNTYWTLIPVSAVKIALGGNNMFGGLSNSGDKVVLYNPANIEIDCVSWGTNSDCGFSVTDVAEGHSISRKPAGADTDTAEDWMDTYADSTPPGPNPGTNPHGIDAINAVLNGLSSTNIDPLIQNSANGPEDEAVVQEDPTGSINETDVTTEDIPEDIGEQIQPPEDNPALEQEEIVNPIETIIDEDTSDNGEGVVIPSEDLPDVIEVVDDSGSGNVSGEDSGTPAEATAEPSDSGSADSVTVVAE